MSNTMRVYISVNVQTQSKWAFTQIKMPGWYRRRLVTLFMDSIQVCSVWHDIKTAGRSSEGRERRQTGGGRWRLERTCVWELSVIHTLLTTTQLCSTQSLGHFTERTGLCAEPSECLWESLKRPPVNQQLHVSLVSLWLIEGSTVHSQKERNKSKRNQLLSLMNR